jgi:ATP-dependent Zn protease
MTSMNNPVIERLKRRAMRPETRRNTAYHEAGHALIARQEKRDLAEVSIAFKFQPALDWDSGGRVSYGEWREEQGLDYVDKAVRETRIAMAGTIAEQIARNKRPIRLRYFGTDLQAIESVRQRCVHPLFCSEESYDAWLRWQWLYVRDMLYFFWPAVEIVAEALLERETITGDECEEIVRLSEPNWQVCKQIQERAA